MQKIRGWLKIKLRGMLVFVLFVLAHFALAQKTDSTKSVKYFGGGVTLTNNGVSLLPSLSLGKPAVLFDMSAGNKKLSFEPQFRFSLEGQPWVFLFWWRYKLLKADRFFINTGIHPAFAFKTIPVVTNGASSETLITHRYLAGELSPNYLVKENISVGLYFLYSHGFDKGAIGNTYFVTINSNFSKIKISDRLFMRFHPQAYYLRMDDDDGYYVTATIALSAGNLPFTLQSIVSQPFVSNIPGGKDFVWNVSLIYAFRKEYVEK